MTVTLWRTNRVSVSFPSVFLRVFCLCFYAYLLVRNDTVTELNLQLYFTSDWNSVCFGGAFRVLLFWTVTERVVESHKTYLTHSLTVKTFRFGPDRQAANKPCVCEQKHPRNQCHPPKRVKTEIWCSLFRKVHQQRRGGNRHQCEQGAFFRTENGQFSTVTTLTHYS